MNLRAVGESVAELPLKLEPTAMTDYSYRAEENRSAWMSHWSLQLAVNMGGALAAAVVIWVVKGCVPAVRASIRKGMRRAIKWAMQPEQGD